MATATVDSSTRTLISQVQLNRRHGKAIYWAVLALVLVVFTLVYLVYQDATNFHNFGGSAAIGTVLLLFLGLFSGAYLWLNRRGEE